MSCETELKLLLAPELHALMADLPLVRKARESFPRTRVLTNTYFDTPEFLLRQARTALRIRTVDGGWIQTLKTKGESINGLSRRTEHEWSLHVPELDFSLLESVWPETFQNINFRQLKPVFRTDFERIQQVLLWQGARIEMALDKGEICAADQRSAISELELELLDGDETALITLGQALAEQVELKPCDISKAQRGYALLAEDV